MFQCLYKIHVLFYGLLTRHLLFFTLISTSPIYISVVSLDSYNLYLYALSAMLVVGGSPFIGSFNPTPCSCVNRHNYVIRIIRFYKLKEKKSGIYSLRQFILSCKLAVCIIIVSNLQYFTMHIC